MTVAAYAKALTKKRLSHSHIPALETEKKGQNTESSEISTRSLSAPGPEIPDQKPAKKKTNTTLMWDNLAPKAEEIIKGDQSIKWEDLGATLAIKDNFHDREVRAISTIIKELQKRGVRTKKGRRLDSILI